MVLRLEKIDNNPNHLLNDSLSVWFFHTSKPFKVIVFSFLSDVSTDLIQPLKVHVSHSCVLNHP